MGSKKIDVSALGKIVSTNIRAQLGIRRMSNRELARQMGRSESYVRARINDEKEWNLNDIGIISQIWAISPDRLVIPMVEEADDSTASRLHEEDADALAERIAANPEQYAIAANRDPNKDLEREGGEGR
ncbi:hypothetical protein BW14_10530 [Bifidobacterium sp. UTBIF-68]|nr:MULTISPECIES: hypothetical protein [Bifidobacterium]TPF91944.1 hypothetical protein BW14_10530 [Bifidobacterium sp. UTBIF-68]